MLSSLNNNPIQSDYESFIAAKFYSFSDSIVQCLLSISGTFYVKKGAETSFLTKTEENEDNSVRTSANIVYYIL